ncbi:MAG TPA: hypothetical protein VGG97_15150 [Bryobacteraceae bacterium]
MLNPEDSAHDRAVVEFLTFFSGKGALFRVKAVAVVRSARTNKNIRIVPQTHESFSSGLELYASRPDKGYSLTDCISMQTMQREGLRAARNTGGYSGISTSA